MKKIVLLFFLFTGVANAEIKYDYKNLGHKGDKECIAMLSIMRTATFDNKMMDQYHLLTELQNKLLLKYEYSKQLNSHVAVFKSYAEQMVKEGADLTDMAVACVFRAENS